MADGTAHGTTPDTARGAAMKPPGRDSRPPLGRGSTPPAGAGASLNWKEIDLVLSEVELPGSLIEDIHQPSHDRFVLDLFRRGGHLSLLACVSSRYPRIHAIRGRLPNPPRPPRFAAFLRAHIRGGKILTAEQVSGERIVRLVIRKAEEEKTLWIRLWGSAANAILTDSSGIILDAFYRRPARGEVSGKPFEPLPARATAQPASLPTAGPAEPRPAASRKEYTIRDLPGEGSFSEKLEAHFGRLETEGDLGRMAAQAEAELTISENKVLASLERLQARLGDYAHLERYKQLGDLLTSNLHRVHKGDRWLRVEDFYNNNVPLDVELAPELSPTQNAERYYDRHRKARLGKSKVEEEVANLQRTLAGIQAQRASIAGATDPSALGRLAKSAAHARKPLQQDEVPGLVFSSPPYQILVGRTAKENDQLLRSRVRGNDWWFHARDWPGAYVFVKAQPGKSLPLETMLDAATLAVHFSKGKSSGRGDVYYTQVKYLRRAKGARLGTVIPTQEKNLSVSLDPARIERLKAGDTQPPGQTAPTAGSS